MFSPVAKSVFPTFLSISAVFIMLGGDGVSFAADHFVENFDSLACAYADTNTTLPSGVWTVAEVFNETAADSRGGSGSAARINDDKAGAHLTTPSLDSVGTVTFYYRELNTGGGIFNVQKAVAGGVFVNVSTQSFSGNVFTNYSIDINDPSAAIEIRILNDNQSGHLIIDDMTVTDFGAGSNQPPVLAAIGNQTVSENALLTFPVQAADPADGDPITMSVSNEPPGTVFNATDGSGTFTWTFASPVGVYTSTFYASDKDGIVSESITITVEPSNGSGATNIWDFETGWQGWTNYSRFSNEDWWRIDFVAAEGSLWSMYLSGRFADEASDDWLISPALDLVGVSDPEFSYWTRRNRSGPDMTVKISTNYPGVGDPLAPGISWETLPFTRPESRRFWEATTNDLSAHIGQTNIYVAFHYTSTGTGSGDAEEWFVDQVRLIAETVSSSNEPPVLNPIGNKFVTISNQVNFTVIGVDPVDGDFVTVSVSNAPPGSEFIATNGVGSFVWTNASPAGLYTSVFYAVDKDGVDFENVIFTVNDPNAPTNTPTLAPIGDKGISEGNSLLFSVTASDPDGDAITMTASNLPAGADFSSTNGNGTFSWVNATPGGTYTTVFYAADNDGEVSEEILISVYSSLSVTGIIVFQGFEGTTNDTWNFTGVGETTNDAAKTGSFGRRLGGSESVTLEDVSVAGYDSVMFHASVASTGGIENVDALDVFISLNGTPFSGVPIISIREGNALDEVYNRTWPYEAVNIASADAGTNIIYVYSGDGSNGYATIEIDIPTTATSVSARISAHNNNATEYYLIDDIKLTSGEPPFSDAPMIDPVADQLVNQNSTLIFDITATDPGGDPITLSASNLPPGAVFLDHGNDSGVFLWADSTPMGVYTARFFSADDDGINARDVVITVDAPATTTNTSFTIMSANLTSGSSQAYEDPGIRIMQGLKPDIVGIQEFNYGAGLQALVDTTFGPGFHWYEEPGSEQIPNGIISRYPILSAGEWEDTYVSNRDFAWAIIDIPGTQDLHVVSAHFLTSSSGDRNNQAVLLKSYIEANWNTNDMIVICGDLNTLNRSESAITTLKAIVSDAQRPGDQNDDWDTNASRASDYDYVLPNSALEAISTTTTVGGMDFVNGIVFDSRLWATPPSPVVSSDSGEFNMQHMAVMKTFVIGSEAEAPTNATVYVLTGTNGSVTPGTVTVGLGGDVAFTVTPDPGYVIGQVLVDGESSEITTNVSLLNVTNNRSLAVTFEPEIADGDQDADGLPDWYELQNAGNVTNMAAGDDDDGDDVINIDEFRAKTQPTNDASFLGLLVLTPSNILWQGGVGATQLLERSESLDTGSLLWTPVFTNLPPTPISNAVSTPPASSSNTLFYRIRIP